MFKISIIGPFFNPVQIAKIEFVKNMLVTMNMKFFSPKDHCESPDDMIGKNLKTISDSDAVIALIDDKDPGSIFQAGFAYAVGVPILYLWLDYVPHQKLSFMIGKSGALALNNLDLEHQLKFFAKNKCFDRDDVKVELV